MKKKLDRRGFLRVSGASALAVGAGCGAGEGPDSGDASDLTDAEGPARGDPPVNGDKPGGQTAVHLADTGAALPRKWPSSYASLNANDTEFELRVLSGKLPSDMWGHAFINGPIPYKDPNAHPFNGDGLLRRIDFGGPAAFYKQRVAKTACYIADKALEGTDEAFSNAGLARMQMNIAAASALGVRNQANTSFQPIMDGRMVIATDAGRPYEIDTDSLEVVTPVGAISEWKNGLFTSSGLPDGVVAIPGYGTISPVLAPTIGTVMGPLMENMVFPAHFSSAHPVFDSHTNEFFTNNINFVANDEQDKTQRFTDLLRWDGAGALERFQLVLESGENVKLIQSGHQMVVTELYVIIMDSAVNIEINRILDPSQPPEPQAPDSLLYIVRRDELPRGGGKVRAVRANVPGEAGHFTADYENPDGKLVTYFTHLIATDLSEWLVADDARFDNGQTVRSDLNGFLPSGNDINTLGRHVIDGKSGRVLESNVISDDDYTWATLFHYHRGTMNPGKYESIYWASLGHAEELMIKRVAEIYRDHPYRRVALEDMPNRDGRASNLFHADVRTMKLIDGYRFPPGRVMGSPTFVPRAGSTGWTDGYIVSLVISDDKSDKRSSGDEIWIFDAKNLAQGPLTRLGHPELDLSFTIHTAWLPEIAPRTASYHIKASDDYAARLDKANASQRVRDIFTQQIYPRYG